MSKFNKLKKINSIILSSSITFFSFVIPTTAKSIPNEYKYLPNDSAIAINVNVNEIGNNKLFTEIFNTIPESMIDKETKNNIGENVIFAITDLPSKKDPHMAFILKMKNKGILDKFKKRVYVKNSSRKDAQVVISKHKTSEIYSVIPKDTRNKNFKPDYYIFDGNNVVISNNPSSVSKIVKSYYSNNNLLNSYDFKKMQSKLTGKYSAQIYLNSNKFFSAFLNDSETKVENDIFSKGWEASKSMLINFDMNNKNIELDTYTLMDNSKKYVSEILKSQPSTFRKVLHYIPKDAVFFSSYSDMARIGNYYKHLFNSKDIKEIDETFQSIIGFTFNEFMSNVKNDFVFAAFNTQDNPVIPGFAVILTPKDKAKMLKTMSSFSLNLDEFGGDEERGNRNNRKNNNTQKKGESLRFVEMGSYKDINIAISNDIPELSKYGIKPVYTMLGEDLIIASNQEVISKIIDRSLNSSSDFSLDNNSSFMELNKKFGSANNSLGYINPTSFINILKPSLSKNKNSNKIINNLTKIKAIGFNSTNDSDGTRSKFIVIGDFGSFDFENLIPDSANIQNLNENKSYY